MSDFQDDGLRECDICFEKVGLKKLLPCGHDLCIPCLEKIYTDILRKTPHAWEVPVACPECRQEIMIETKSGIEVLPNRFFGNLKCGFCQLDKPTDEMWWCPICVKILCSKCDVKDHRGFHHQVFEWNSLRGVADCIALMTKNRKLENDLKNYFSRVTAEILTCVNASSERSELAVILANAYRIHDGFPDSGVVHESDKSHELSNVIQQAFSLADIEIPAESAAPSDGERKIQEIIANMSPQAVANSLLSGDLSIRMPETRQPTLTRQPIRPAERDVFMEPSDSLYPSLASGGPPPSAPLPPAAVLADPDVHIAGMTRRNQFPLTGIPVDFFGMRTNAEGTALALFGRNDFVLYANNRNSWEVIGGSVHIRSGIIDMCFVPDSDKKLFVVANSGPSSMAFLSYTIVQNGPDYWPQESYKDILDLDAGAETKICAIPTGTAVYVAQQKDSCDMQTVIYKYSVGGVAGLLSWLQKMLLYPVAKRSDNDYGEEFGELQTVAVVRTQGEHYSDVLAVGFEHGITLFQISDFRQFIHREDVQLPSAVRYLYFSPTPGFDSVHLRFRNDTTVNVWSLSFERIMTRPQSGHQQKLDKMKLMQGHDEIMDSVVNFSSEDFCNSVLCGDDSNTLRLLRLNLNRGQLEEFRGEGDYHQAGYSNRDDQRCVIM